MHRLNRVLVACLAWSGFVAGSVAAGPKPFDPETGVDPHTYPPDCPVDFTHLKLELDFAGLFEKSFAGVATLTVRPVHEFVQSLPLDAVDLKLESVTDGAGQPIRYDYDGQKITLLFDGALPTDRDTDIVVRYRCVDPQEGMIFALPDEHYQHRPLCMHTQGETEYARYWFPCLDYPVDRCTTEIIVAVPQPYIAIANGALVSRREDPAAKTTTFHYRQDVPHTFYLVSLIIGEFDEVSEEWRGIPVQYFVPPGRGKDAMRTFGRTPEMMEHFSNLLGVPYPYAKYAQTCVQLFQFGGMENTSATTLVDTCVHDERSSIDDDSDGLIAHELAHQWFGDLITCRGWQHLWLNEGFATFMDSIWTEYFKGREEYLYEFWKRYQGVTGADTTDSTDRAGILFHDYEHSDDTFGHKGSLVYSKGSCVMHMLRHQLGDELFWRSMQKYVQTYQNTQAETDDLRRTFEAVTGRNLEQFFDQWVARPGTPQVEVGYAWDAETSLATVTVTQTQHIDRNTPAFAAPLDLYFRVDGQEVRHRMNLVERKEVYTARFDAKPELFCVDPEVGLLMRLTENKPTDMWEHQLAEGPTSVARCMAVRALAKESRPEAVEHLHAAAAKISEHWTVRVEAADALGDHQTPDAREALLALLADPKVIEDHKVRRALVSAAGKYDRPEVGEVLAKFAQSDASYHVEAAATRALGNVKSYDAAALLTANADKYSPDNNIRYAAIDALTERGDPQAFEVAKKYAAYGQDDRIRGAAIRALGRIGRDERERRDEIRPMLVEWLSDEHVRAVEASIDALAEMADEESLAALRRFSGGGAREVFRKQASDALVRAKPDEDSETVRSLRGTVEDLHRQIEALQERLEKVEQAAPTDKSARE